MLLRHFIFLLLLTILSGGSVFAQNEPEPIFVMTIYLDQNEQLPKISNVQDSKFANLIKGYKSTWESHPDSRMQLMSFSSLRESVNRSGECTDEPTKGFVQAKNFKELLSTKFDIPASFIDLEDRGLRDIGQIELWIIPFGASLPRSGPTAFSDCYCAEMEVTSRLLSKGNVEFTAEITGGDYQSIGLEWEVSGGTIVKGQGTARINVEISENTTSVSAVVALTKGCCACVGNEAEATYSIQ